MGRSNKEFRAHLDPNGNMKISPANGRGKTHNIESANENNYNDFGLPAHEPDAHEWIKGRIDESGDH
jgi:hypothetical protein